MKCVMKYSKFTLIELLVVIAVIGILVSLLMPSLKKARDKARIAVELSNRSQLMKATFLFAKNNSGKLPPRQNYSTSLHLVGGPAADLNKILLEDYCGSKEKPMRKAMFFCDSTLNKVRNPDYGPYSYRFATVQYFNPPTSGKLLLTEYDISDLSTGTPDKAVWSCLALKTKRGNKAFGHNKPIIVNSDFEGSSTVFFDNSAKWMRNHSMKEFYWSRWNKFYLPERQ